jgi:hypothetical protein
VWQAATATVMADMAGPRIDMASALALATASGAAPDEAADLLPAVAAGMYEAQAKAQAQMKERPNG